MNFRLGKVGDAIWANLWNGRFGTVSPAHGPAHGPPHVPAHASSSGRFGTVSPAHGCFPLAATRLIFRVVSFTGKPGVHWRSPAGAAAAEDQVPSVVSLGTAKATEGTAVSGFRVTSQLVWCSRTMPIHREDVW